MNRLVQWAAGLYPRAWRERYGEELHALIEDLQPRWRDVADVLRGGLIMQARYGRPGVLIATLAIAGALAAAVISSRAPQFVSRGILTIQGPDEARGPVAQAIAHQVLSDDSLADIVTRRNLYGDQRAAGNPSDVLHRFRQDISFEAMSNSVIRVSYRSADPDVTRAVTQDLVELFARQRPTVPGVSIQVLDPAGTSATTKGPRQITMAAITGLAGGAVLGGLIAAFRRSRPRPQDPGTSAGGVGLRA